MQIRPCQQVYNGVFGREKRRFWKTVLREDFFLNTGLLVLVWRDENGGFCIHQTALFCLSLAGLLLGLNLEGKVFVKTSRRAKDDENILSNISGMSRSVLSPDETLRRKYFRRTLRCFIWWWNTVSNAWYYFSNKMILDGKIKDAKKSSFPLLFHLISKHLLN